MFSDPASPEAQAIHEAVAADLRADIEANGPRDTQVQLDDGRVLLTDKDVLDELDADKEFLEIMELCGRTPE